MAIEIANPKCYRIFLVCSNVVLLFVGLSVLILAIKMKWALSMLMLINIPIVMEAVKAVIATGFFISLSGVTGICGACCESKPLLIGHLVSLGVIVIMEFSLGVTLMIVKKTVSTALESPQCNSVCTASIDAAILDYALPSAGLMMTVIFVEAMMVYSSMKLYFHIRDRPKAIVSDDSSQFAIQNVQMHNVGGSYISTPQPQPHRQFEYSPYHSPHNFVRQVTRQVLPSEQATAEDKPPDYDSLPQSPAMYSNSASRSPLVAAPGDSTEPKEVSSDGAFSQV